MLAYRISGLRVASEVEFPGAFPLSDSIGREPDVTVRRAAVPADVAGATVRGPNWATDGTRLLLCIPNVARFMITAGREIAFATEPGVDERDAAIFLLGSVLGSLLHQRRHLVLHASAVAVEGKAVVFCGVSGAGKSTLAAALGRAGCAFVNDDVCHIGFDADGQPMVFPDGRMLKLWADAINGLALAESKAAPVRNRIAKFYVPPSGEPAASSLPLGALYALREARPPFNEGIETPNVVDAALLLRRNAYRPRLVKKLGLDKSYFESAAKIQGQAGIFYLTRPLDFAALPAVVSWLEAHWREIGLRGAAA